MKKQNLLKSKYFLPYNTDLKYRAHELFFNQTKAELKIWDEYFSKTKYRVKRQKIIDNFIVDFYIPRLKLVIEVDGDVHKQLKERDIERANILKKYDLKILRITNESILKNGDKTYKRLDEILKNLDK